MWGVRDRRDHFCYHLPSNTKQNFGINWRLILLPQSLLYPALYLVSPKSGLALLSQDLLGPGLLISTLLLRSQDELPRSHNCLGHSLLQTCN